MAKLLIFRGEALHDERELSDRSLRIGRSPQNDIVLEDPSKGVSRNHAEIRSEGGRYTLVDLESQNGIWVAGTRVPSVVLEPGVTAALGPFRLTVEAPAVVAEPVAPPPAAEPATDFTQITEQPSAQPLVLDDLAPAPSEKPAPAPPEKPIAPARPKTPPPPKPSQGNARRPVWLAAAAAALLVLVSAVVAYTLMNKPDEPTWNREFVETLVASGACQEALQKHIDPELAANPDNSEARALRERCVTPTPPPPPATTSVPAPPTLAERLDEADALIAANDCPRALEVINAALVEEPENQRATELLAKAKACGKPDPPPPPSDPPAVRVAPSEGGLEPFAKETNRNYRARIDAMRKRYEEGIAALERGSFQTAEKIFDDVSSEVPEGYLDLAQRRDSVRSARRAQAKQSLDSGQTAENNGDFDAAIKAYRRAHDLDPSIPIDAPLKRIEDRRLAIGEKRCADGKARYAYNDREAAISAYQDVLKLLPSSHPCYAEARERLKQLGK